MFPPLTKLLGFPIFIIAYLTKKVNDEVEKQLILLTCLSHIFNSMKVGEILPLIMRKNL